MISDCRPLPAADDVNPPADDNDTDNDLPEFKPGFANYQCQ